VESFPGVHRSRQRRHYEATLPLLRWSGHPQEVSQRLCPASRARQAGSRDQEAVFGTFTQDLLRLRQWLRERKVKQVAMESTGVYWIPVWNVLEGGKHAFQLTLVNPAVVRAPQGRKTDRIDARRIAEYLRYGLLRGSFIPPEPIRQLRELTRMRVHVQQDRKRVINRIGRLLETVNIKLSSVATHIAGKSGRAMLAALATGVRRPEVLADKALGSLRSRIPNLILALDGRLCEQMAEHAELIERLSTIPGVERTTARVLIAELGTDMTQFPTPAHLASWAGLCPGNAESAGKRFSGKTRKGDRYLRRIPGQSAWAAARTKRLFPGWFVLSYCGAKRHEEGRRRSRPPHPGHRVEAHSRGSRIPGIWPRCLRPKTSIAHGAQIDEATRTDRISRPGHSSPRPLHATA
jgi:transposase